MSSQLGRLGKYEILGHIGAGGMGTVYRARLRAQIGGQQAQGAQSSSLAAIKEVALKVIHPHLSQQQDFILMFLDEVRLSMAMSHRNIVQTFDAGSEGDLHFFVMELVAGWSLRSLLNHLKQREVALPPGLAVLIAAEVCAGLHHAHTLTSAPSQDSGVIHRDVSPSNILLSTHGEVKLTDFGVARAAGRLAATLPDIIKGKLPYMAPEQARGAALASSDLFSLGAVLHEMVYNKPIRSGGSLADVLDGKVDSPGPAAAETVPPTLGQLISDCLAPAAEQRPDSAATLQARLAEEAFRLQLSYSGNRDMHAALRDFLTQQLPTPLPADAAAARDSQAVRLEQAVLAQALEVPTDHDGEHAPSVTSADTVAETPVGARVALDQPADGANLQGPSRPRAPTTRRHHLLLAATLLGISVIGIGIAVLTVPDDRRTNRRSRRAAASDAGVVAARETKAVAPALVLDLPPGARSPTLDAGPTTPDARSTTRSGRRRSRPTRAAGSRPRRSGLLDINAIPWARVYVDGRYVGNTPAQSIRLRPGRHRVRLVNPKKGLSRTLTLRVRAGKRRRELVHLR